MSIYSDIERDDANFLRIFRRIITIFAIFICIYLIASTYTILKSSPIYMQNWRGATCIVLTILVFLLYTAPLLTHLTLYRSPALYLVVSIWGGMYLTVLWLSFIDKAFLWDFSIVFAVSFALFERWRIVLAVSTITLTMFAFQGLLIWPPSGASLASIASQALTLSNITGLIILFQHLMRERFERNKLLQQLANTNHELKEAHSRLAQSVVQEQELAVLRERTRLAREMHDTIGHALVLISVKLEAAQRLRERDPERCNHELQSTKEIARETMTALRSSIADLRSPALEYEHINQALSHSAREFAQRSSLHLTYTFQADINRLPKSIEETIWKVSQEAFTNIEKHAHASYVQVSISQQDEQLLLHIHDDGIGLPKTLCQPQKDGSLVYRSPNGHYGLHGIHERVEAIGGHLTLHSGKGQGTTIEIKLPLAHDESMEEIQQTPGAGRK